MEGKTRLLVTTYKNRVKNGKGWRGEQRGEDEGERE